MKDYGELINLLEAEAQRCESIFGADASFGRTAREAINPLKLSLLKQMADSESGQ